MAETTDKRELNVEYEMSIKFNKDRVQVRFTGEEVEFKTTSPENPVRPRHLRLISEIHQMMRQYYQDNK